MREQDAATPLKVISIAVSQGCELVRWLFERTGIAFYEELHAPLLHIIATKMAGGGLEAPVVVGPAGVWSDLVGIIGQVDARCPTGQKIWGETDAERTANQALVHMLFTQMGKPLRSYVYHQVLARKQVMYPVASFGAPAWERAVVYWLYPIWRFLIGKALGDKPADLKAAPGIISESMAGVEAELTRRGTPFLAGQQPGGIDVVVSSLLAPAVFPPEYGGKFPPIAETPAELQAFLAANRARPAGQMALNTYALIRGISSADIATPISRPKGVTLLFSLRRLPLFAARLGAWIAARLGRPIRLGGVVIAARHCDVSEVLSRDLDFRIQSVYAPRFDGIGYHFILGMDRSAELARERGVLYEALSRVDMAPIQHNARQAIADRLALFPTTIDVVEDYARPVAAGTANTLFGIAPADNAAFMDVSRAIFGHCFMNLTGDQVIEARAKLAAELLTDWFFKEIGRRRKTAQLGEDMMGQLLRLTSDDDLVRRSLGGMLVGAIDTTATSVAKIITVLSDDPRLRQAVCGDVQDLGLINGWCEESLRRWTHAPLLARNAPEATTLAAVTVPANAKIVLWTQAASFDASAFPYPDRMRPDRDGRAYLHLGAGLHPCAGRAINAWQIPLLVAGLLGQPWVQLGRMSWAGPFPARLPLTRGAAQQ